MIQVLGYFAHSASHTIFNQPITPTLTIHSEQPDPAGEAFSRPSWHLVSWALWVLSQLLIPDPTSPFSPLCTLILKSHIFFITIFYLSARPHRTLAAALPRSWNWLSVFALGPVRCNMPNARDKASFLAVVNGPGRTGLFIGLMAKEWTLEIFYKRILQLWVHNWNNATIVFWKAVSVQWFKGNVLCAITLCLHTACVYTV